MPSGMTSAAPPHHPLLPLALRLAAMAAIATMALFVKLAADAGIHLVETLFWRQALGVPMILGWLIVRGRLDLVRTARPGAQAVRAGYGLAGMFLNFGAISLLPLAEATTLSFTSPIFAVLLSIVLLREKVGAWRWTAVLLGFAGVLVIAQPGGGHLPLFGAAVGLGGAFMIALISIQIADLNRTERPITIVLWFASISSVVLLLPVLLVGEAHDRHEWLLLLATGVSGSIGQLLLTASLRFGKIASVIVMDYSSLAWATLYGWLVWQVLPPATTWFGAPLIIGAGAVIGWRERRLHNGRPRAEPIGPDPV
jgi:drug/metabolite transporter (DMT)-like permease